MSHQIVSAFRQWRKYVARESDIVLPKQTPLPNTRETKKRAPTENPDMRKQKKTQSPCQNDDDDDNTRIIEGKKSERTRVLFYVSGGGAKRALVRIEKKRPTDCRGGTGRQKSAHRGSCAFFSFANRHHVGKHSGGSGRTLEYPPWHNGCRQR